jgi:mono/diheme cytochrome c family protein
MKTALKWTLRILGGLLLLIALGLGAVYGLTSMRMSKTYTIKEEKLTIPSDPMTIERGRHFATAVGKCTDCHGEDLGGKMLIDDAVIGKLAAANLTRGKGGRPADYSDADWVRAIRHGVRRDGTPLIFMPSHEYWHLSDDDLAAVISYLKSAKPVDRIQPETSIGPLPRVLAVFGQMDLFPAEKIDHNAPRPPAPAPGPTVEYGEHMVMTGGCMGCHGPTLSGGPIPAHPPEMPEAGNLTPDKATGLGAWTEADFFRMLRTGKRPDGRQIDPSYMPWKYTAQLTDDEIRAIWRYLQTVPAKPKGNR